MEEKVRANERDVDCDAKNRRGVWVGPRNQAARQGEGYKGGSRKASP